MTNGSGTAEIAAKRKKTVPEAQPMYRVNGQKNEKITDARTEAKTWTAAKIENRGPALKEKGILLGCTSMAELG